MRSPSILNACDGCQKLIWIVGQCLVVVYCLSGVAVAQRNANQGTTANLWKWTNAAPHHDAVVQVSLDGAHGTGVVVRVDNNRPIKSGFASYVLTANHVVEADKDRELIEVHYGDGTVAGNGKIIESDEQYDIALIETWAPAKTVAAKTAMHPARDKTYLEFVGLGGGANLKSMRHFSTRATQPTTNHVVYADTTLLPGDSGGPIFNRSGELVGIISGGWFWWNSGATTANGDSILSTWPARASNVHAIQNVMTRITEVNIARR